jgi:exopolysaccharide/PEP-CTERM locus tyrosine autokinase
MSLVERALKKMQESRSPASSPERAPENGELPGHVTPRDGGSVAPANEAPRKNSRIVKVDRAALVVAELLAAPEEERRLAHEYRQIKRPLIANAYGRGVPRQPRGQVMLVASALPGDGKTFTSINLALSLAIEKDISVLLIDADVAKRHLSNVLGVSKDVGLLDAIRDEHVDVESLVLRTDFDGLEIMPAGSSSENATELLASSRMESIVAQLTARNPNRIVLLDSPPLLLTSESRVLCSVAGQVVLVVNASKTPRQAVFDAITHIGEGRFVGLVLNQCAQNQHTGYYDYYGKEKPEQTPLT